MAITWLLVELLLSANISIEIILLDFFHSTTMYFKKNVMFRRETGGHVSFSPHDFSH